jgi:hypothetical protein
MSFLMGLDEDKLSEILPILEKYDTKCKAAETIFQLEGRKLEEIMRTIPHYQASYDQSFQELKGIEEWLNVMKDKNVGKKWKKYTESYSRQLTTKDIQAYIAAEKEIVEYNQLLVEVTHLKNSCESIVEAIKQMGWMMSNVTKLRIAEMQDAVL